ncbi:Hypothetical_protein [Hexamita inflata]|uniref:Hypothetical_protein n=1 Tax=Hexamita inflata TaxID=28002 RepID=A0AA86NWT8_9EUKA|nr:Hypothetical protein HINF_LOCUS14347 [Hexamita inflata]
MDQSIKSSNIKIEEQLQNFSNNLQSFLFSNVNTIRSQCITSISQIITSIQSNTYSLNSQLQAVSQQLITQNQDSYNSLDTKIFNNLSSCNQNLGLKSSFLNQKALQDFQKMEYNVNLASQTLTTKISQNQNDNIGRINGIQTQFQVFLNGNSVSQYIQQARNIIESTYMKKSDIKPPRPLCENNDYQYYCKRINVCCGKPSRLFKRRIDCPGYGRLDTINDCQI